MADFTPGDFQASIILNSQALLQDMFPDNLVNVEDKAHIVAYEAIKANQTADMSIIENPNSDVTVEISFMGGDVSDLTDCVAECDTTADEFGTDKVTYVLDNCKETKFKVDMKRYRNNKFGMEQEIARGFDKADQKLSQGYANNIVSGLALNAGTNLAGAASMLGNVEVGGETTVALADFNEDFFIHAQYDAELNGFDDMFLLHGSNLWKENKKAICGGQDLNGKCAASLFASARQWWDIHNVDDTGGGVYPSYMIQRGTVATADRAIYPDLPLTYAHKITEFRIASNRLAGVYWDVEMWEECEVINNVKRYFRIFKVIGRYDTFFAPLGTNLLRTGTLQILRGA